MSPTSASRIPGRLRWRLAPMISDNFQIFNAMSCQTVNHAHAVLFTTGNVDDMAANGVCINFH